MRSGIAGTPWTAGDACERQLGHLRRHALRANLPMTVGLGIIEVSLICWDSADEFWRGHQLCAATAWLGYTV